MRVFRSSGAELVAKRLARAAVISASYVVLIIVLAPVSFGPLQFRAAEALTTLPILFPEAVPALWVGALLGNIIGGLGPWDIFGGSFVTLLAAWVTRVFRKSWIAYASPVVLNAFLVSAYLYAIAGLPYLLTVLAIGASEAVVVILLGIPLVRFLRARGFGEAE